MIVVSIDAARNKGELELTLDAEDLGCVTLTVLDDDLVVLGEVTVALDVLDAALVMFKRVTHGTAL